MTSKFSKFRSASKDFIKHPIRESLGPCMSQAYSECGSFMFEVYSDKQTSDIVIVQFFDDGQFICCKELTPIQLMR